MKELITNIVSNKESVVYKSAKDGQTSFRITQQFLQSLFLKAKKVKHIPAFVLTIPANKKENYVLKCHVTKEKK